MRCGDIVSLKFSSQDFLSLNAINQTIANNNPVAQLSIFFRDEMIRDATPSYQKMGFSMPSGFFANRGKVWKAKIQAARTYFAILITGSKLLHTMTISRSVAKNIHLFGKKTYNTIYLHKKLLYGIQYKFGK
jgi:hypothetical protein